MMHECGLHGSIHGEVFIATALCAAVETLAKLERRVSLHLDPPDQSECLEEEMAVPNKVDFTALDTQEVNLVIIRRQVLRPDGSSNEEGDRARPDVWLGSLAQHDDFDAERLVMDDAHGAHQLCALLHVPHGLEDGPEAHRYVDQRLCDGHLQDG